MKTQEVIKGVKEMSNEVSAWENRVTYLKTEEEGLQRKNAQIKKDIESGLQMAQVEVDRKREWSKKEEERIRNLAESLESQKVEFAGIMTAFKKERDTYETEKAKMLDLVEDTRKMRERLMNYITMVRRESERL